jgi:alkylmercury lyase
VSSFNIHEFTQTLINKLERSCDKRGVCRQLLKLLAHSRPVAIEEIAATLQMSHDEVAAVHHCFPNIQFNHEGSVIGMGLTLSPTAHHFHVNGHSLYTWCALDALVYPAILQQTAQVESICPVSGHNIRLVITPDGVAYLEPGNAVISIIIPASSEVCCNIRNAFCNHVNFFSSPEAATRWLSEHENGVILTVREAYQVGRILAEYLYQESSNGT